MSALMLLATLSGLCGACPPNDAADLQGVWNETAPAQRYSLTVCANVLIGTLRSEIPTGTMASIFRLNQQDGTIDIDREEGVQLGLYKIGEGVLTLVLSNVNQPRPQSIEPMRPKERRQTWERRYVFSRQSK